MRAPATRLARLRHRPPSAAGEDAVVPPEILALTEVRGWTFHGSAGDSEGWRLRDGAGARMLARAVPDAAASRLAVLVRLRDVHVEPVLEIVESPSVALVPDSEDITLAELTLLRGQLDPGELARLGASVGAGLAAIHAAHLTYGPLTASDILVSPDGRARLAVRLDAADERNPADDVADAARVVARSGAAGSGLAGVLADAQDPVPWSRPDAVAFAGRCQDTADQCPLRVPDGAEIAGALSARALGADPARGPLPRRRELRAVRREPRARRRWLLVLPVLAAIAVGAVLLVGTETFARAGAGDTETADPVPDTASSGAEDAPGTRPVDHAASIEQIAGELTVARLEALGGDGDIADVTVAGSPAAAEDSAFVERLTAQDVEFVGLTGVVQDAVLENPEVHDPAGEAFDADADARVRVTYVVEAHEQRTGSGTTAVEPQEQTDVLVLQRVGTTWLVRDVE
ncbi:hypothetical protein SAMN04489860_1529 [Paraoerskovia marina]|uniref:Protein kinase domain-containing protein n=1 Tax=Paraoerskovia marina TaxID=545619 RepID=A0A1H1S401_9CELL|nr:hypothetical protein [Paraoerskovia marina]SDS42810.1 hypothetical protein SAMN04489860_1529 [Paraoerskovia marina]